MSAEHGEVPAHTPGPARHRARLGCIRVTVGNPLLGYVGELCVIDTEENETAEGDARLLAAAYTSYDKHCGPRAVECAEADLLGKLIRIVDRYKRQDEAFKGTDNALYRDACEILAGVDQ